jgi:hypothetical protein
MTPADKLLPRLAKVRQVKPGQWQALCPAHDDKSPSMRIKEAEDGTLLVKCWTGCSAEAICAAAGLELRDLFPGDRSRPQRRGLSIKALQHEGMICRIGDALLAQGMEMSADDRARYDLAKQRMGGRS